MNGYSYFIFEIGVIYKVRVEENDDSRLNGKILYWEDYFVDCIAYKIVFNGKIAVNRY